MAGVSLVSIALAAYKGLPLLYALALNEERQFVPQSRGLGPCALGPVLQVWPERMYYRGVALGATDWIIDAHVLGGAPVDALAHAPGGWTQALRAPGVWQGGARAPCYGRSSISILSAISGAIRSACSASRTSLASKVSPASSASSNRASCSAVSAALLVSVKCSAPSMQ